jgi:hypothetical protein
MPEQDYDYNRRPRDPIYRGDAPRSDNPGRTSSFWGWVVGMLVLLAMAWMIVEMVARSQPPVPEAQQASEIVEPHSTASGQTQ